MLVLVAAALMLLVSTTSAMADGFSFKVAAGMLVINQADNLNGRSHDTINSLDEKPRSSTRLLPIPLLELRYSWEGNSVYFGSPADDPIGLNLGYRRKLDKGALAGSFFYSSFGREWQNPYLVGTPRSETRVTSYGGRVAFEDIGGVPLTLSVKGTVKNLADEALTGELRRDGGKLDVEVSWRQLLSGGWAIVPLAFYQRGEYQGSANSFHGAGLGLGANWRGKDLLIATRLSGNRTYCDQVHPVFHTTRRDYGYRFSSTAILDNPFSWQNTYASAGIIHNRTGSNVDFFETRATFGFAAIGYKF